VYIYVDSYTAAMYFNDFITNCILISVHCKVFLLQW